MRDDDRRPGLADLRADDGIEVDPEHVTAARRPAHSGQPSTSVRCHSRASDRRHFSRAAARYAVSRPRRPPRAAVSRRTPVACAMGCPFRMRDDSAPSLVNVPTPSANCRF